MRSTFPDNQSSTLSNLVSNQNHLYNDVSAPYNLFVPRLQNNCLLKPHSFDETASRMCLQQGISAPDSFLSTNSHLGSPFSYHDSVLKSELISRKELVDQNHGSEYSYSSTSPAFINNRPSSELMDRMILSTRRHSREQGTSSCSTDVLQSQYNKEEPSSLVSDLSSTFQQQRRSRTRFSGGDFCTLFCMKKNLFR